MAFLRVRPDDDAAVAAAAAILEAARPVDDPAALEVLPEQYRRWIRYGWDLHPAEVQLYRPAEESAPVGVLSLNMPVRDNHHLVWSELTVHPARRRQGHGSAMMAEVLRRTAEAGRTTIWMGCPADDPGPGAFLQQHGFRYASHDARRHQRLPDVDPSRVERLRLEAEPYARDYDLIRLLPPYPDDLLREIAAVAVAINDAPMGDLTYEPEVSNLEVMRDIEAARVGRQDLLYRVVARHRLSRELAGHTVMSTEPLQPSRASQCDTAVSRDHRGHRLGLLLKIEMMHWLAEVEPQLEIVETFNQADNTHMITVNEALGYRLDRVFHMYERQLDSPVSAEQATADLVDA
jgi:GNAT superfamily N-acetyltransferase/RimJ/RimL family protein N-acetyltransferase